MVNVIQHFISTSTEVKCPRFCVATCVNILRWSLLVSVAHLFVHVCSVKTTKSCVRLMLPVATGLIKNTETCKSLNSHKHQNHFKKLFCYLASISHVGWRFSTMCLCQLGRFVFIISLDISAESLGPCWQTEVATEWNCYFFTHLNFYFDMELMMGIGMLDLEFLRCNWYM